MRSVAPGPRSVTLVTPTSEKSASPLPVNAPFLASTSTPGSNTIS
jgi:hypothetical protein